MANGCGQWTLLITHVSSPIVSVRSTVNLVPYKDILEGPLLFVKSKLMPFFVFQHDNAPCTLCGVCIKKCLVSKCGVKELDRPAQIPYLNLTEHL